eukprot:NODE_124_length_18806_cov_0.323996.p2 type:complete len:699 gc:universal NODE_124_length_18806_cov_0.323996:11041-8945(-)
MIEQKPKTTVPQYGEFNVYMNNKIEKLNYQNNHIELESRIFENLTFHINGDTSPPFKELKMLILTNGGKYEQYRLNSVDFFIAEELSESKKQMWKDKIVVRSSFITDSINSSKVLKYQNYELFKNGSTAFIRDFYQHSRLHYLSLWKEELKNWCSGLVFKPNLKKKTFIAHIDLDAFFVSASLLNYPQYANCPVAVSHGSNVESSSADIACCNYVAREFAIKNGMHLGAAKRMCPSLVVLPYDFDRYRSISKDFYSLLIANCDEIEAISCDEAFIDISNFVEDEMDAVAYINNLRLKVFNKIKIEASAGIGHNKILARIATKKAKPCGEYYLSQDKIQSVLQDYSPDVLPGVGWKMCKTMKDLGILNCGDLIKKDSEYLQLHFGKNKGHTMYEMLRGIDKRSLNSIKDERQSVSAEINWGIRFTVKQDFIEFLNGLAAQVVERLVSSNSLCAKCALKLMVRQPGQPVNPTKYLGHGICDTVSFVATFPTTNDFKTILKHVTLLADKYNSAICDLRGVGIQLLQLQLETNFNTKFEFDNKNVKKSINQEFFNSVNKSIYDELPSSLQLEVYHNWKREQNENGLLQKLKRARGNTKQFDKVREMPGFNNIRDRKAILDKIREWIINRQDKGPPDVQDKLDVEHYLNELVESGYSDFATEIMKLVKYLTAFRKWSNEFKDIWREVNLKIQNRYVSCNDRST